MTEYDLAPVFITFVLGLSKFFIVLMALYIPIHLLARVLSFNNIHR